MNPLAQSYWDTYWGNNEKPNLLQLGNLVILP